MIKKKKTALKVLVRKVSVQLSYLISALLMYGFLDIELAIILLLTYIIYKNHGQ